VSVILKSRKLSYLVKKAVVVLTQESKPRARELSMRRKSIWGIFSSGIALVSGLPAFANTFVINPTFTSNFNTEFGTNAATAQAAWTAAANVFTTNFSDNITVN